MPVPSVFSSQLCSLDGKPFAKLQRVEVLTLAVVGPQRGIPGGLSLQSSVFPARSRICVCFLMALALKRLAEGSGAGSQGIKADIVRMSSRCSERICRHLAEAAGGTSPCKGLCVPTY